MRLARLVMTSGFLYLRLTSVKLFNKKKIANRTTAGVDGTSGIKARKNISIPHRRQPEVVSPEAASHRR